MEESIKDFVLKLDYSYVQINDHISINKIYNLFYNKIIYDTDNDTEQLYLGFYYEKIEKNYELMKKYYLMAIDHGNEYAMKNLANYYGKIEKNYDHMKKYYLMAIDKSDSVSMNNLGYYYQHNEINYDLMKKYYLMAISQDHELTIRKLLSYYSKNIHSDIYDQYFLEFINKQNNYLQTNLPYCFKLIKNLYNKKINLMQLHFDCALNSKVYDYAKNDFLKLHAQAKAFAFN